MKIAIVGGAPSSCNLAPIGDLSWEIWVCSPGNFGLPRVDAWFELHSLDRKWVSGNEPYIEALTKHPRVYIAKPDPRLPNGVIYPKDAILAKYNRFHHSFFSSSPAWMLAFAIEQRPEEIGMWGIDMAAAEEYEYQRPGCHFFMGIAEAHGIKLTVPPQSDIMETHPLYAYKEHSRHYWKTKARKQELNERLERARQKQRKARDEELLLTGAMQSIAYEENTWMKI